MQYGDLKLLIGQLIGAVFVVFCIFIMIIAETGNEKLGFNFALLTYYASRPRETQFNAFMANNFIDNVIAASVVNLIVGLMEDYTRGSYIYWIHMQFQYSKMNFKIFSISTFTYVYLIVMILSTISLIFIGANRIRYADVQAAKEAKKKGK